MSDASFRPPRGRVTPALDAAAAYSWRLLVVGAVVVFGWRLAGHLLLVLVPLLVGLLVTALLRPLVAALQRARLPRAAAVWMTVLIGFAVLGGVLTFVSERTSASYGQLTDAAVRVGERIRELLLGGPLHVNPATLDNLGATISSWARGHTADLANGALVVGRTAVEALSAIVVTFFITFFLLWDGPLIWSWLVGLFRPEARPGLHAAGQAAWSTLARYITGTVIVASFHGVVVAVTLALIGAPLAVPVAVLVFLGSFIPLIGAVLFGGVAVVLAFVTVSPLAGLVMLVVLLVENQMEAHLLQPLVVGRYVRVHPLAIILVITAGTLLAGLVGAVFAVPLVATLNAAVGGWRAHAAAAAQAPGESAPTVQPATGAS